MESINKKSNKAAFASILTAIAASLCCITPILALVAGTSGIATTFSWMEPFRPFLIGLTVLVLGFAWYQKLKSKTKEEIECACEQDEKPSFWQSTTFLLIITLSSSLLLAVPYYSKIFHSQPNKEIVFVSQSNIVNKTFAVEGMTCLGCEAHVESEVNKLNGIVSVKASYENTNTVVSYDKTKIDEKAIIKAINNTGYHVLLNDNSSNK